MGNLETLLTTVVTVVGRQVPERDAAKLRAAFDTWVGTNDTPETSAPAPVAPETPIPSPVQEGAQ